MNIKIDPSTFEASMRDVQAAQIRFHGVADKSLVAPLCPEDRETIGGIRDLLAELDTKLVELKRALSP